MSTFKGRVKYGEEAELACKRLLEELGFFVLHLKESETFTSLDWGTRLPEIASQLKKEMWESFLRRFDFIVVKFPGHFLADVKRCDSPNDVGLVKSWDYKRYYEAVKQSHVPFQILFYEMTSGICYAHQVHDPKTLLLQAKPYSKFGGKNAFQIPKEEIVRLDIFDWSQIKFETPDFEAFVKSRVREAQRKILTGEAIGPLNSENLANALSGDKQHFEFEQLNDGRIRVGLSELGLLSAKESFELAQKNPWIHDRLQPDLPMSFSLKENLRAILREISKKHHHRKRRKVTTDNKKKRRTT
jgi:hypothetical protein